MRTQYNGGNYFYDCVNVNVCVTKKKKDFFRLELPKEMPSHRCAYKFAFTNVFVVFCHSPHQAYEVVSANTYDCNMGI